MENKMTRKALPKKLRFEVFKRDNFTCQYCGRQAPQAILQVDHIEPVARGGKNNVLNLLTSCRDCNSGKGAVQLSGRAVVERARAQAEAMQDRREQIAMMAKWQVDLLEAEESALVAVVEMVRRTMCTSPNKAGLDHLQRCLAKYGLAEVMESIRIARIYLVRSKDGDNYTPRSVAKAFDVIGGICFNRAKERDGTKAVGACRQCGKEVWLYAQNGLCRFCWEKSGGRK